MPRYHINIFDDEVALDEEGIELPDFEAARHEAVVGGRALIAEQVARGAPFHLGHYIEIADDQGAVLETIRFRDIVALKP